MSGAPNKYVPLDPLSQFGNKLAVPAPGRRFVYLLRSDEDMEEF